MTFITRFARRIPVRFVIGVMIFLAGTFGYMLTFNFSIGLLAMVEPRPDINGTVAAVPDFGPRYAWTSYQESLVIGAYFYGNVLSSIPIGLLLERYGWAKMSILVSFLLCTVLSMLSPLAAGISLIGMFVVRFMIGILQGGLIPAYTFLISKWAPSSEIGLFTITNMGTNIGTILTLSLSGVVIESYGWAASFYVTGSIALLFAVSWMWFVFDSPAEHPRITDAERAHIASGIHGVNGRRSWPPLWSMARSVPVWALLLAQFSNSWGAFFVLTAVPKFLNEILGFQLGSTGFLSSLPYVMRTTFGVTFGYISNVLEARYPNVSLTVWRKVYCIFSHVIPGLLLIAIPFAAESPYACVALMTMSYGCNGAVTVVTIANYHDLAPNYATSLNSIINGLGNTSGFLSPLVIAYFTQDNNTIAEWRSIFYVGAAVYIIPAILFALGGSGAIQAWNGPGTVEDKQARKRFSVTSNW